MKLKTKTASKKAIAPGMLIAIILVLLVGAALFVIFFGDMFPHIADSIKGILGMGQSYAKQAPDINLDAFKKELADDYVGKDAQFTLHIYGDFNINGLLSFDKDFVNSRVITNELSAGVKRAYFTKDDILADDKSGEIASVDEISKIEIRMSRNMDDNMKVWVASKDNPQKGDKIIFYAAYYDKEKKEYNKDNAKPVLEMIYYGVQKENKAEGMYIEYEIKPYFDVNQI